MTFTNTRLNGFLNFPKQEFASDIAKRISDKLIAIFNEKFLSNTNFELKLHDKEIMDLILRTGKSEHVAGASNGVMCFVVPNILEYYQSKGYCKISKINSDNSETVIIRKHL
jgi:hypothetical protein